MNVERSAGVKVDVMGVGGEVKNGRVVMGEREGEGLVKLRGLEEFLGYDFGGLEVREVRLEREGFWMEGLGGEREAAFGRQLGLMVGVRVICMPDVSVERGVRVVVPKGVERLVLRGVYGELVFEQGSGCEYLKTFGVGVMPREEWEFFFKEREPDVIIPRGVKEVDLGGIAGRVVFEKGSECGEVKVSGVDVTGSVEVCGREVVIRGCEIRGRVVFGEGCVRGKLVGFVHKSSSVRVEKGVEAIEIEGEVQGGVVFEDEGTCGFLKMSKYSSPYWTWCHIPASVKRLEVGEVEGRLRIGKGSELEELVIGERVVGGCELEALKRGEGAVGGVEFLLD